MGLQEDTYNTSNLTGSSYTVIYNRMEFKFAGTLVGVKVKTVTAGDYTLRIKSDNGITTYQTHTIEGASAYSWITFDITELEVAIGEKYRMEVTRPSGKAYAGAVLYDGTLWKNNKGAFGGSEFDWTNAMGFLMLIYILVVSTEAVTDIKRISATGNGTIENVGLSEVSKRGICWNTTGNPTVADSKSEEEGSFDVGAFTRPMTDLTPGDHYYVKAYAYDSEGYSYGGQVEFDTPTIINVKIDTILQYAGIGPSRHCITRTSDGILYAAKGAWGNQIFHISPIRVYKSTDNGWTWTKDFEYAEENIYASDSQFRVAIAVDGNDKVHLAFGRWWWDGYYSHGNLMYATKPKGGSWSAANALTDYYPDGTTARGYYVSSMVIDGLNQVHILYQAEQGEHHWFDGSWHKETVFGGFLVVDPSNTLYLTYSPYDHYAKKPVGGGWSTHAIPDFLSSYCLSDKDGNLHFFSGTQYRKLNSNGVWGELETWTTVSHLFDSVSVTQDGVVHIIVRRYFPPTMEFRYFQRSIAGDWSWTKLFDYGALDQGDGASLLHAVFPVYGTYYPCLLEEGYAFVYKSGSTWLGFTSDPEFPSPPAVLVSTNPASAVGQTTATLNGTLDYDGGVDCECNFEWGLDTGYGITTPPQIKVKGETFSQVIGGLAPNTVYHFRAFATNVLGTSYGADRTFTTGLIINKSYALAREEL